jgi:SAM-dependent methyltransferase
VNRAYWDRLAERYSDEVLEITTHDRKSVLADTAAELSRPEGVAGDFGCGVGATTRVFAPHFPRVLGIDFSPKLLEEARRRTDAAHVEYIEADLAGSAWIGITVDVGFCVNCLISPRGDDRMRIARQVAACLRPAAPAVFVVPSLESVLRTYQAMIRLDVAGGARSRAAAKRIDRLAAREIDSAVGGIVEIGDTPTKHYLGDEIAAFVEDSGFAVERLDRVEYDWEVELELEGGPRRHAAVLGERTPWDWLVLARRV